MCVLYESILYCSIALMLTKDKISDFWIRSRYIIFKKTYMMLSLLCSFSSRFLIASFSSFCCLQQLALEPKSVASHSSSLSFSLLSLITKVLWKCKPVLGSEVFFEVFFLAGVSSVCRLVHGVGCIDWVCLVGVSSVWRASVVGRFDWAHV